MTSHPIRDGAEFFPAAEADRRAYATASSGNRDAGMSPIAGWAEYFRAVEQTEEEIAEWRRRTFFPASMVETCSTVDATDRRVVAMAREYCRMLRRNPDDMIGSGRRREPRYRGYLPTMHLLLAAADSVTGVTPRPRS